MGKFITVLYKHCEILLLLHAEFFNLYHDNLGFSYKSSLGFSILDKLTDYVWGLHVIGELILCVVLLKFCKWALVASFKNGVQDVQLAEVRAQALATQCILLVHYGTLQVGLTCGMEQDGGR